MSRRVPGPQLKRACRPSASETTRPAPLPPDPPGTTGPQRPHDPLLDGDARHRAPLCVCPLLFRPRSPRLSPDPRLPLGPTSHPPSVSRLRLFCCIKAAEPPSVQGVFSAAAGFVCTNPEKLPAARTLRARTANPQTLRPWSCLTTGVNRAFSVCDYWLFPYCLFWSLRA